MSKIMMLSIIFIFICKCYGQNLIAVQNGTSQSFYPQLDSAIAQAQNGDTIYIPGGTFTISTPITKSIHLVGVGHHPDSTLATNRTIISGGLKLESGCDNGSISGVHFSNSTVFTTEGQISIYPNSNGYTITRCYISGGISASNPQNLVIQENVIGSFSGNWWSVNISNGSAFIANNMILGRVTTFNSLLKNNIFFYKQYFSASPLESTNSTIENNVFQPGTQWNYNFNGVFLNNLNSGINGLGTNSTQGNGNVFISDPLDSIFVNYSPTTTDWVYYSDFHIRSNLSIYQGGTDGSQIGIYGGSTPWKDGSVPFNPHVQLKNISGATTPNGNLRINIKVAAQDH